MRPRLRDKALPSRVYIHHGSYWFRPLGRKPLRLARVSDGLSAMHEALAKALVSLEAPAESVATMVNDWKLAYLAEATLADETRTTYGRIADDVSSSFRRFAPMAVSTPSATNFLANWKDRPRMRNEVRKVARQIFDWGVREGRMETNPFDKTLKSKVDTREVYIPDDALRAILDGALEREDGRKSAVNGLMARAFVELCYLTGQRAQDIRLLRWADVGELSMQFEPTKTSDSSGLKVKFVRTPEIERVLVDVKRFVAERNAVLVAAAAEQAVRRAKGLKAKCVAAPVDSPFVIHRLDGKPFAQTGVRTAWRRAIALTDYKDSGYTIKDIRPKALTDADESMELRDLQKMAVHTSITTTEGYLRKKRIPTVTSPLSVPKRRS